jgi:hypothetical protein
MNDSILTGQGAAQLVATLIAVREALEKAQLPLAIPDVEHARTQRAELVDQLDDYVLPRLLQIEAPLLTVVGGSTGAGKSTLVNSLVGERVTEPGVLRPTTRSPVLVYNPADAAWFDEGRILPDLRRTSSATADPGALQLVPSEAVPAGLAVVDAPDIDSVEEQNRVLAAQLLAAADLWLFVTSAARYADHVPWEFLKAAADRSAAVAIVLDRTRPDAIGEVSAHLARMLTARGLRDSPLFIVPEGDVGEDGLLPSHRVREIRGWLSSLAADADARGSVVRQTLAGVIRTLPTRVSTVADACHDQVEIRNRLYRDVSQAYSDALAALDRDTADATLVRGEVQRRWQDYVGTGELLYSLESKVSLIRDRLSNAVKGQPQQATLVTSAIATALQAAVQARAESAAEQADRAWRRIASGRQLLDRSSADLARASRDLRGEAARSVDAWQQTVLETVRAEGADKRATARFLALGLQGLAVSLMIVVLAANGGGGSSSPASQARQVLEAVFDAPTVRRLTEAARADLNRRMEALLDGEAKRFVALLDELGIAFDVEEQLRSGARRIDDIRFGSFTH